MRVHRYTTVQEFLAQAQEYLEQQEIINSLPLGLCQRIAGSAEQLPAQPLFAVLFNGNAIAAVALRTPPHQPIVVCNNNDHCQEEMEMLARAIIDAQPDVSGVAGRVPVARFCAEAMARYSKQSTAVGIQMHLYEAKQITPAQPCKGSARLATFADTDVLTEWTQEFLQETLQPPVVQQKMRAIVQNRIQNGEISVWENECMVSMAAKTRSTRNTASIASVYTPKKHRGHGYAAANVATFSQKLLSKGYNTCVLFTDAANPTSNAIYKRIGYRPVCDFAHYKLGFA